MSIGLPDSGAPDFAAISGLYEALCGYCAGQGIVEQRRPKPGAKDRGSRPRGRANRPGGAVPSVSTLLPRSSTSEERSETAISAQLGCTGVAVGYAPVSRLPEVARRAGRLAGPRPGPGRRGCSGPTI